MKSNNILTKDFVPIFSGIKPSANMTLPSYYRQLVYLEGVLNQLIDDSNDNYDRYDEYIIQQLSTIKDTVQDIVVDITSDTIDAEVSAVVAAKIEGVLLSINNINTRVDSVETDLLGFGTDLSLIEESISSIEYDLGVMSSTIDTKLIEANNYADSKKLESDAYTDTKVSSLSNKVDNVNSGLLSIDNKINGKVDPLVTRLNSIASSVSDMQTKVSEVENKVTNTNVTILSGRVSTLESTTSTLRSDLNAISSSTPDVSGITARVTENENRIGSLSSNYVSLDNRVASNKSANTASQVKIENMEGRLFSLEQPISEIGLVDRVESLESDNGLLTNRVTELEVAMDGSNSESIETLKERVRVLEMKDLPITGFPLTINFIDGVNTAGNELSMLYSPYTDEIVYKGTLIYNYTELEDFSVFDALTDSEIPLNIDSEIPSTKRYNDGPVIYYQGQYTENGEIVYVDGIDIDSKYSYVENVGSVDGKVRITSDVLKSIYDDLSIKTYTDFSMKIVIESELTFEQSPAEEEVI